MVNHDLCIAWNWEYDADFVRLMDGICAARGLSLLSISTQNLKEVLPDMAGGGIYFRFFLDRASEADFEFLPLVQMARTLGARRLNPRELADHAYDKAFIHQAFLEDGVPTPETIILPCFLDQPLPAPPIQFPLKKKYIIKPALGGGGEGVMTNVQTLEQVQAARAQFPDQQYLLQEQVTPKTMGGLPAWFRVIHCLDEIYTCYWDVKTHVYTPLPVELEERLGLGSLRELIKRIARICKLDLFSTEIVLTEDERLLAVDYVNDPIDLRLQSRAMDGVPDIIVERIAVRIAGEIKNKPDGD